jgi:hypothetical protein
MLMRTLAFALLLASAGPGLAQTPPDASPAPDASAAPGGHGRGAMRACAADRQTYCASAERGPASMQCMKDNFAKLSPDCQGAMKAMQARRQGQGGEAPPAPAPNP